MKTVTEKKTIEKTVHKYISNDGKEFITQEACLKHEEELRLKEYLKRYNVNDDPGIIKGITDDTLVYYSLKYTGKKEDFIFLVLLSMSTVMTMTLIIGSFGVQNKHLVR